jgi:hypothetical protein
MARLSKLGSGRTFMSAWPFGLRRDFGMTLPGELRERGAVVDRNQIAAHVEDVGKVPATFGGGRHSVPIDRAGDVLQPLPDVVKAEEPRAVAVPFPGNIDGPAEGAADGVVAVAGASHTVAVAEEIVGVEGFLRT